MTTSKRLAAFRAAQPKDEQDDADLQPDPTRPIEDEEDDTTTSNQDKENKDMTTVPKAEHDSAVAAARAEGAKAERERTDAITVSEHYKGREALAKTLLATGLSAEDIDKSLAAAPIAAAPAAPDADAVKAAAEAAARAQMQAALDANTNSDIDAGGDASKTDARAEADARWAKARPLAEKGVK